MALLFIRRALIHTPQLPTASAAELSKSLQLPVHVQAYLDAIVEMSARVGQSPVSVVLFGSATRGGFSVISDVDLIIVLPDGSTHEHKRRLREEVASLEIAHGFRQATFQSPGASQVRIERAVGHMFSCCVCTRGDLISGDVARVLDLRRWEAPFVDRIIFASIIASAVTVRGEDLLTQVAAPPVRRLDVAKAFFGFSCQLILSVMIFPLLPDATKYAMGILKHSLHSCFFCYHQRTAPLAEEVDFFNRRLGVSNTLLDLLSLRRDYRRSFVFVIRCLPAVARLHLRTGLDNPFRRAA